MNDIRRVVAVCLWLRRALQRNVRFSACGPAYVNDARPDDELSENMAFDDGRFFFDDSDLLDHCVLRPLAHIRSAWELTWDPEAGGRMYAEGQIRLHHLTCSVSNFQGKTPEGELPVPSPGRGVPHPDRCPALTGRDAQSLRPHP
jgi:hypothetical protein